MRAKVQDMWLVHRPARTTAGLRAVAPGVSALDLDALLREMR
jgi:hypothetical protein